MTTPFEEDVGWDLGCEVDLRALELGAEAEATAEARERELDVYNPYFAAAVA